METTATAITITIQGALLIAASVAGTGFLIWKASSDAHKDIRKQLREVRENDLCDIRTSLTQLTTDIEWLKYFLRSGKPPPEDTPTQ
ncbi:MAG: hypothetical protein OXG53_14875 [Chloroflexi bacterium]|nr:hypothetical protein [Chloroflexota bacterium]